MSRLSLGGWSIHRLPVLGPRIASSKMSLRLALVLGIAGVQIVSTFAVLIFFYFSVEKAVQNTSKHLLVQRSEAVKTDFANFLMPSYQSLNIMARLIRNGAVDVSGTSDIERSLLDFIRSYEEISGAAFFRLDGSFIEVRRSGQISKFVSRSITQGAGTTIVYRDDDYLPVSRKLDSTPTDDPRERAWFDEALVASQAVWIEPFQETPMNEQGAAMALPVRVDGSVIGLIAIDMNFEWLGQVLLNEGRDWALTTTILDETGQVVLHVDNTQIASGMMVDRLVDIGDPITSLAYSKYGFDGVPVTEKFASRSADGKKEQSIVHLEPLTTGGLDWVVSVHAAQDDLTAGLQANQRRLIWIALSGVILFSWGAIPIANWIRGPLLRFSRQTQSAVTDLSSQIDVPYHELAMTGQALEEEINRRRQYQTAYERTFETSLRGMARIEPDTYRFLHANEKLTELLGLDASKIGALSLYDVIDPSTDAPITGFLAAILDDRESSVETKFYAADGTSIWLRMTAVLIRDHAGEPDHALVIFDDIQEARATEAQLEVLRQDIKHVDRVNLMGQFASVMAHELNQPLGAMVMDVDSARWLLNKEDINREELSQVMSDIGGHAQRSGDIIRALRQMVQRDIHPTTTFPLHELLDQTKQLMEPEARAYGIVIRIEAEDGLSVYGHRSQLAQVLVNIIRNAIEAIGRSMVIPAIVKVSAVRSGSKTIIHIEDNGPGIPAHIKPFSQFESTHPGGLGLGLSICKSLVNANEGTIRHEDVEPRGARFTIELPCCPESETAAANS